MKKMMSLFKGKDTPKEEMKEAKALKAGKMSSKEYVKGERSEGDKKPAAKLQRTAAAIKKGEMSPKQYASGQKPPKGAMKK